MNKELPLLEALFFDFDGVIIDSTKVKTIAFRTLFNAHDDEVVNKIVDYHKLHGGISRVEKIRYAHEHILHSPLREDEIHSWAHKYSRLVVEEVIRVDWIKGAKEFLEALPKDLLVFVISGTPEEELEYIIEQRGMSHYFDKILGSPTLKTAHIDDLLRDFLLDKSKCVFIGDAMTDYKAAMATGMPFIGIQGEVAFPPETLVLRDCRDLGPAISRNFKGLESKHTL